ncbi:hypothetical protein [Adonisia turfae]|nr:hypothetical protein [Adonisia turfae]
MPGSIFSPVQESSDRPALPIDAFSPNLASEPDDNFLAQYPPVY